jgi:hypothetical protein
MRRLLAIGGVGLCAVAAACSQGGGSSADGGDDATTGAGDVAAGDSNVAADALSTTPEAAGDSLSAMDAQGTEAAADTTAEAAEAGDAPVDSTVASEGAADATSDADALSLTDAADAADGGSVEDAEADADAAPDADDGGNPEIDTTTPAVTLTMTFSVAPGAEVFECESFANPWGRQVDVKTYGLQATPGLVNFYAFYQTSATSTDAASCSLGGLAFGPFTFFSGVPQATLAYPPTVGATIPVNAGFQLSTHYINQTSSVVQATVSLTMDVAKSGVVTNHAGVLFLSQPAITTAPSCTSASGGCLSTGAYALPQAVNVMATDAVTSAFTTSFLATTSTGITIDQTQWPPAPAKTFAPALSVPSGTTVTWSCRNVNDTGSTLTFGEHSFSNLMCISRSAIYPISDVTNPVIGSH